MDKKTTKKISIIAAALLIVAGAVGTIYYFTHRSTDELKKVTLDEIISDSKIPDREYDNLDFSNAVLNIPDVETFSRYYIPEESYYTIDECAENCYELFDLIFDYVKKENPDFALTDSEGNPLADGEAVIWDGSDAVIPDDINGTPVSEASVYFKANDESEYSCRFTNDGSFIIYNSNIVQVASVGVGGSGIIEEIIHLDRGEKAPDTKYLVDGKEYSPSQAIEFAENVMSEKLGKFLPSDEVSPTELIIIKDPDTESYIYRIQFEHVYDGTPYFHLLPPAAASGYNMGFGVIYITIAAPNRVGEIYNMTYYPQVKNDGAYEDEYISLEAAADLANEYLAPHYAQEIAEVTIKYTHKSNKDGKYFRPYWCFVIDQNSPWNDYCLNGKAIYVDMQTGEVIVYDTSLSMYMSSIDNPLVSEELL